MERRKRQWVYVGARPGSKAPPDEKASITEACDKFIAEVLKPRFLPEVRPTEFNYCIDIYGKWHGPKYRFIQRYRTPTGEEFEAPFARLEYTGRDRFDIGWHRHTGQWFRLHRGVTLAQALRLLEIEGILHPV